VPLIPLAMCENDELWQSIVVVNNVSISMVSPLIEKRANLHQNAWLPNTEIIQERKPFKKRRVSHVKYTIDSCPLFFGTVNGALGSSTT
jgi:hypothetical protein